MSEHFWGDETFDWKALDEAIDFVVRELRTKGRITAHGKEKWGELRIEFLRVGFSIHGFLFPGYLFKRNGFPGWLFNLDLRLQHYQVYRYLIDWWFIPYQQWIYRRTFRKAVQRWPHIAEEILEGKDWDNDE